MKTAFDDRISYEIFEDGYDIYDGNQSWITQREPYAKLFIPDGTYEENAIAHCEDLTRPIPPQPYIPTEEEKLRADVDYIALMSDYVLPSEEEE